MGEVLKARSHIRFFVAVNPESWSDCFFYKDFHEIG